MNSIAFWRYANKIEFQKNLAENKGEKRMGKYGDGKKSKEAIKKSRLLDQEFKKLRMNRMMSRRHLIDIVEIK